VVARPKRRLRSSMASCRTVACRPTLTFPHLTRTWSPPSRKCAPSLQLSCSCGLMTSLASRVHSLISTRQLEMSTKTYVKTSSSKQFTAMKQSSTTRCGSKRLLRLASMSSTQRTCASRSSNNAKSNTSSENKSDKLRVEKKRYTCFALIIPQTF